MLTVIGIFPLLIDRLIEGHFGKLFARVNELLLILRWLFLVCYRLWLILDGCLGRRLRHSVVKIRVPVNGWVSYAFFKCIQALVRLIKALHLDVRILHGLTVLVLTGPLK